MAWHGILRPSTNQVINLQRETITVGQKRFELLVNICFISVLELFSVVQQLCLEMSHNVSLQIYTKDINALYL